MKKNVFKIFSVLFSFVIVFAAFSFIGCGGENAGGDGGNGGTGGTGGETSNALEIKYYNQGSDLLPMLISGRETIGLLPEPAASTLEKRTAGVTWYRLSLQQLYDSEEKAYPQAVLMIKSSVLEEYPEVFTAFSEKTVENVEWAKSNTADAVAAVKNLFANTTLTAESMTSQVIDNCKIYFQSAADGKESVNAYIEDIRSIYSASANVVNNDFYYSDASGASEAVLTGENTIVKNNNESFDSGKTLSVYAPDGAPALAIAKFINDSYDLGTGVSVGYNIVKSDEIGSAMAQAKGDIIIMPVSAATKMYAAGNNQSDPYKLAAVMTHGNFYIMSTENITLNDLKGKRIGVPNRGQVPDWTFQSVLNKNDITFTVAD